MSICIQYIDVIWQKKLLKRSFLGEKMGFLSKHVPGTIELGKLKNHNQDYQFNFLKLNYIFSAFLADQDLIVYYAFTFQSIEVWFFDTCYFMSHGHVFALPWRYWAITWKCFIYNVFFIIKSDPHMIFEIIDTFWV